MRVSKLVALLQDLEEQEGDLHVCVGKVNQVHVTGVWLRTRRNSRGEPLRVVALATGVEEQE